MLFWKDIKDHVQRQGDIVVESFVVDDREKEKNECELKIQRHGEVARISPWSATIHKDETNESDEKELSECEQMPCSRIKSLFAGNCVAR